MAAATGAPGLTFPPRLAAAARTFFCSLVRAFASTLMPWTFGFAAGRCLRAIRRRTFGVTFDAGNGLPDQPFDRGDRFVIERGNDGDRGAGSSRSAGTADAVDVIVGMMRDIEIEHVAHGRNIQTAGGDVGSDQQRNFALAELIERGGSRRLIHIAVQRADAEAVLQQ